MASCADFQPVKTSRQVRENLLAVIQKQKKKWTGKAMILPGEWAKSGAAEMATIKDTSGNRTGEYIILVPTDWQEEYLIDEMSCLLERHAAEIPEHVPLTPAEEATVLEMTVADLYTILENA